MLYCIQPLFRAINIQLTPMSNLHQSVYYKMQLFFDYRYDDQMDNELIYKPDHSVNFDWMNKKNGQKK